MTPAEELLAALKEHATAEDTFSFNPAWPKLSTSGKVDVDVLKHHRTGEWFEYVYGGATGRRTYEHASASSAVYSAFLRARK